MQAGSTSRLVVTAAVRAKVRKRVCEWVAAVAARRPADVQDACELNGGGEKGGAYREVRFSTAGGAEGVPDASGRRLSHTSLHCGQK